MKVFVERCDEYEQAAVDATLERWSHLFSERIRPGQTVALKPNWLAHCQPPEEMT